MDILEKIIIPLLSAFIGALLAFIYQRRQQKRQDKLYVFGALMANRHAGATDADFVKALNLTDVVFHKNQKVREALHKYFLYTKHPIHAGTPRLEAFYDLLRYMAEDIGYKNLKHSDLSDFYAPAPPEPSPPPRTGAAPANP
jgi:hypothetical protein